MKNVYQFTIEQTCTMASALNDVKFLLEREVRTTIELQKTGFACASLLKREQQNMKYIQELTDIFKENTEIVIVGD